MELAPRFRRADARRRAGIDEIARLEGVVLRQEGDLLRHGPDHVRQVGLLALLAVDVEPQRPLSRVADFARRYELAAGGRFVEVLAEVPRTAMVLAPLLQVAARHVETDGVAVDMVVSPLRVDSPAAFT